MDVDEQNAQFCSARKNSKSEEECRSEEGSQGEENMSNQSEEVSIMPPTIKWLLYTEEEEEKTPSPKEDLRHKH